MILVTGGTGLVGAHLLYQLSLENDCIKAIHRKNSDLDAVKKIFSYYTDDFERLFQKIKWVEADITDICALEIAFDTITEVYHAAALISFDEKDYRAMRKINIDGTANIVNFCIDKKVKKLCFVSSIVTIGRSQNKLPTTETNEWDIEKNNYGYAITKFGAEMEVWRASQEGVPVVIVNPGVILGSGFWNSGSGELFSKIHKGFNFYTEGVTGYVSVYDVVKVMVLLMKSPVENERYILVSENKSFRNVLNEIALNFNKKLPAIKISNLMSEIGWRLNWLMSKLTGSSPLITKRTSKTIHQKTYYSSEKIQKELNFDFEDIERTIEQVCSLYKN